jgi:MFS family permease
LFIVALRGTEGRALTKHLNAIRRSLFLISMPMVFISFALPLRAEDLGASAFQIGLLFSLFTASLFILRPIVGLGLDKFGRRPFFIAALALYLLANAFYAFSEALVSLYVARLFQGIGFAFLSITTDTLTADLTEVDDRPSAMGANIASQTRGGMVGAFVGFGLVGAIPLHAWVYSFTSYTLVALLALVFAWRAIPETLVTHEHEHKGFSLKVPKALNRLLAPIFLMAFASSLIQPFYIVYLRDRFEAELVALATVFLPVGLVYALLPAWIGKVTKTWSRVHAMSFGLGLAAIFYALVPHMTSYVFIILVFTGGALGSVLAELTRNAWVGDISDGKATGRAYGVAALATGIGSTLGPLAGGAIYDAWGKDLIFYSSGFVLLLTALLVLGFKAKN